MRNKLIYLLLILTTIVQAQDYTKPFAKEDFPAEKFQINHKAFPFQELAIEFILVKALQPSFDFECLIYLKVLKDNKTITQKSIGFSGTIGTYGIPETQPVDNYFMFSYFGEWNGEISLVDTTGKLISFPGYYWAISKDKRFIFTKAIFPSSDLPVAKFNVDTGKFITKEWNLNLKGEPWDEVQPSEYKSLEIELCE